MGVTKKDMATLWHIRIRNSSNQVLKHISYLVKCNFDRANCCDVCHKAKQCRNHFPLSIKKAKAPFELIHRDLQGKYHTATNNGSHYFATIVDDYTLGTWIYLMKHETETFQHMFSFSNLIKR